MVASLVDAEGAKIWQHVACSLASGLWLMPRAQALDEHQMSGALLYRGQRHSNRRAGAVTCRAQEADLRRCCLKRAKRQRKIK